MPGKKKKSQLSSTQRSVDPSWNQEAFKVEMKLIDFLTVLIGPEYAPTILREVRASNNRDSYSARSMISKVYRRGRKVDCHTFNTCLLKVLVTELSYETFEQVYVLLKELKKSLFPDDAKANTEATWASRVNNAVLGADFLSPIGEKSARHFLGKSKGYTSLFVSTSRKFLRKSRAKENRSASMTHPSLVPESMVIAAINEVIDEADVDKGALSPEGLYARIVACQLCCGMRFKGVFTQKFGPFDEASLPTIVVGKTEEDQAQEMFGVDSGRLIVVTRIVNERSKAAREVMAERYAERMKKANVRDNGKEDSEGSEEDNDDGHEHWQVLNITKKELRKWADKTESPGYYVQWEDKKFTWEPVSSLSGLQIAKKFERETAGGGEGEGKEKEAKEAAADVPSNAVDKVIVKPLLPFMTRTKFFQYLSEIRTHRELQSLLALHSLPPDVDSWSDDFVHRKNAPLEAMLIRLGRPVSKLVVRLFGTSISRKYGSSSGSRTHFSRTLYAAYAFALYGGRTQHLAFLQNVLGHSMPETSINYAWVKVIPVLRTDGEPPNLQFSRRLAAQELGGKRIKRRLTEQEEDGKRLNEELEALRNEVRALPLGLGVAIMPHSHRIPMPALSGGQLLVPPRVITRKRTRHVVGESQETPVGARERLLLDLVHYVKDVLVPLGVDVAALSRADLVRLRFKSDTICGYFKREGAHAVAVPAVPAASTT